MDMKMLISAGAALYISNKLLNTAPAIKAGRKLMALKAAWFPAPSLHDLPPELHLEIFSYLDHVSATCLGLTCKRFYHIWLQTIPQMPILYTHFEPNGRQYSLRRLLQNWMGGKYVWHYEQEKFVGERLRKYLDDHYPPWCSEPEGQYCNSCSFMRRMARAEAQHGVRPPWWYYLPHEGGLKNKD